MTKSDKPTTRETTAEHKGRAIIATIHRSFLQMRLKGLQNSMEVMDIQAAYELCAKKRTEAQRRGEG